MDEYDYWWFDALCREVDADMFFAEGPGNTLGPARKVCARCPVRLQCLVDELQHEEQAMGVFGGFGQERRERMRKRIARGADRRLVALRAIFAEAS